MLLALACAFQVGTALIAPEQPLRDTVAAPPAAAVYSGRLGQLNVAAIRHERASVLLDGQLDDAICAQAALLTGFSTYSPVDGRPAQDSTEVRLFYTAEAMYVSIRGWAPAGTVRATLAERDRISNDDWIAIHFDTFNDRQRAFVFGVNALGVQADGMRSEQSAGPGVSRASLAAADLTQDFVWQSKGRLLDDGFAVEIRIPFKSVRFQMGAPQDGGCRWCGRHNATATRSRGHPRHARGSRSVCKPATCAACAT